MPGWAVAAIGTVLVHVSLAIALDRVEPREPPKPKVTQIQLVQPPPKRAEPPPPVLPPPPIETPPVVHEKPTARPTRRVARVAAKPVDTPAPLDAPSVPMETTTTPVYGATLSSSTGSVPVPVGNTQQPTDGPRSNAGEVKPLAAPTAAMIEVSKMPVPRGRCSGKYTEAARAAALEGTVILDLVVDETGRSREITVVSGLAHGLTEAAIAALRACQFTPGERDGKPVAVRVRGFKIRFLLDDG